MKRYVIDSIADICDFFADLSHRTGTPFYPEDDLALATDANGNTVFSQAEIDYFDDVILDCFVYCNDHHLDLHELFEEMQQDFICNRPPQKIAMRKTSAEQCFTVQNSSTHSGFVIASQRGFSGSCA